MEVLSLNIVDVRRRRKSQERLSDDASAFLHTETVLERYIDDKNPSYSQNSKAYQDLSRRRAAERRQYPRS